MITCRLARLPEAAINSYLLECTGQGGELLVVELVHEQLANTAQVDTRRLRQAGDAGVGQPDHDAAPVGVAVGARDQSFVDEAIDAAGHARPRAVGLGGELTDAHFSARLPELGQDVEIAQGEADVVDEVRCELAHERGVGVDERPPGREPARVWDRLGGQTVDQRRDIGSSR